MENVTQVRFMANNDGAAGAFLETFTECGKRLGVLWLLGMTNEGKERDGGAFDMTV